uniref:Uncharacterized protein n=2 Tax=Paracidobacterium acidisoli TaxID=2303751 RepID=A0A372IRF7_9BACT
MAASSGAAAGGGSPVSSGISAQADSSISGHISVSVGGAVSEAVDAGTVSSGHGRRGSHGAEHGWQPSKMQGAAGEEISGFSTTAFAAGGRQSGIAGMREFSGAALDIPDTSGISGATSAGESLPSSGAGASGSSEALLGFPDSTRMVVSASPSLSAGSQPLFGFDPGVATGGMTDFANSTFLNPTLHARRISGGARGADLDQKIAALWKRYEFGIGASSKLSSNGLVQMSPLQQFQQQRNIRKNYGIYGAAIAQHLSEQEQLH